jgi:hypothetical protein
MSGVMPRGTLNVLFLGTHAIEGAIGSAIEGETS